MNQNRTVFIGILALLAIGIPSTAFAQETVPSELEFMVPVHAGLTEVATNISHSSVQIVGALIILGIGYGVGRLVEKTASVVISRMTKFGSTNEILKNTVEDVNSSFESQIKLIPATLKWFVYIIFIIASVNALGLQYLSDALEELWLWIPNIIASVIVLILGTILVRFIDKWILEKKFFGSEDDSGAGARTIIKVVIYGLIIAVAITQLGIGGSVIPTLVEAFAWGIAGAFALGIGLAGWKVIPQYVLSKDNERMGLKVGNSIVTIESKDEENKTIPSEELEILQVGITKIKVKTADGTIRFIPHNEFEQVHFGLKEQEKKDTKSD